MPPLGDQRADLEVAQAALLAELAAQRLLVVLAGILSATGCDPPGAVVVAVTEEQNAIAVVDEERPDCGALGQAALSAGELPEPAKPLAPGDRGVCGRGGRKDEELGPAERPFLEAELGPRAERAAALERWRLMKPEAAADQLYTPIRPRES